MKRDAREVLAYVGYTVSTYFLCRYVNNDFGLLYRFFAWMFISSTVFFFEGSRKEVIKEIVKCALILLLSTLIDAIYREDTSKVMAIFIGQITWQGTSVVLVWLYYKSELLHGKYSLKLATEMSIISACVMFGLRLEVVPSVLIVCSFGLLDGLRYWCFNNADKRIKENEEQTKMLNEQKEQQRIKSLQKENNNLSEKVKKYEAKERLQITKSARKKHRENRKNTIR